MQKDITRQDNWLPVRIHFQTLAYIVKVAVAEYPVQLLVKEATIVPLRNTSLEQVQQQFQITAQEETKVDCRQ